MFFRKLSITFDIITLAIGLLPTFYYLEHYVKFDPSRMDLGFFLAMILVWSPYCAYRWFLWLVTPRDIV